MAERSCYLETDSTDPGYNLAFEEYVLTHRTDGDYLILWQNDNTIVIGQNQNAYAEIRPEFVKEHQIRVVRRKTGGGSVYHDLGNLNYSFITDLGDADRMTIEAFTVPVVRALKKLGLNACASGRNDILVDGKKVSGTAQRLYKSRMLHHGTLLFDSDASMIEGALNADPEKFRSKGVPSVRSRIGNIRPLLPSDMTMEEFRAYLKQELAGADFRECRLEERELAEVRALQAAVYDTWQWNYGKSPAYEMVSRRRFDGGTLEVRLNVTGGYITDIAFFGDFLSLLPLREVTDALRGCPNREEDIRGRLARFAPERYFGGISVEEVLSTIQGAREPSASTLDGCLR